MMRLPDSLEQKLWQAIATLEGETQMRYVTSVERLATERGMQQGLQQGMQQGLQQGMQQGMHQGMQQGMQQGEVAVLRRQLHKRFGELPEEIELRLNNATLAQLEVWADRVLDARTLDEVLVAH
jgi:flagellar biosynthesis/type III secretory pathway protein FliH